MSQYLGSSFLGTSFFGGGQSTPPATPFIKVILYGKSIVDKLRVSQKVYTLPELLAINITDTLMWDSDTLAMCEFNNTTSAGNVGDLGSPLVRFDIYRKEITSSLSTKVASVASTITEYVDYTITRGLTYIYEIFPVTATKVCSPLVSNDILADYFGYYLIDESDSTVFWFDWDVISNSMDIEEDFTTYNTYTKYGAFAKGNRQYYKTSVSALATNTSEQTIAELDLLKTVVSNDNTKLWKTRKGQIFRVKTHGYSQSQLDDGIGSQPYKIGFNIIECAEV